VKEGTLRMLRTYLESPLYLKPLHSVPLDLRNITVARNRLTFGFQCNSLNYRATISYFPGTNELAEIFISNSKAGSDSDSAAKDSAVVCSLGLQHGVPVNVIRKALLRASHGRAASPLGVALDIVSGSSQ
jgi:hypothetical protein